MTGSRVYWVAAVLSSTLLIGCGSTSTANSQSGGSATSGSAQPSLQATTPLTADIAFSGGLSGTLALNSAESNCQLLPSGTLSATFDGVVPGSEAAFNVLEPPGTKTLLAGGDEVGVDTSVDFWHSDTSGTAAITVTGNTATGMVTAVIAGSTGSGVNATVPDLHVTASFSCPVSASGG